MFVSKKWNIETKWKEKPFPFSDYFPPLSVGGKTAGASSSFQSEWAGIPAVSVPIPGAGYLSGLVKSRRKSLLMCLPFVFTGVREVWIGSITTADLKVSQQQRRRDLAGCCTAGVDSVSVFQRPGIRYIPPFAPCANFAY